ncbi:hypothetical protein ACFWSF_15700 [Streptomyces sp. NPDC058611]|uniref:hypothetical protein n=1 Tax=unclassified Streptomyces TaxID=2593676 RepID=UPI00364E2BD8
MNRTRRRSTASAAGRPGCAASATARARSTPSATARTRSAASAAVAAAVLAGLVTAAGPAVAAGQACTPGIVTLPSLTDGAGGAVTGFGANGLAVGSSGGRPVYWTADRAIHEVPLPEGFRSGQVRAVNARGLMVGTAQSDAQGNPQATFTYRIGDPSVRLITAPSATSSGADVNDAGHVVALDGGVAKEWIDGAVVRELPVPADAHPSTVITSVDGINKRGDIVGTAYTNYVDWENDTSVSWTFPVVWPAGNYPARSLPVWNEAERDIGSRASDIDGEGRVVGYEQESYRDVQRRTPALWKQSYTALPADPGPVAGYGHLTLDAVSPTTNVTVGTAVTYVDGYAARTQAAYWPGKGPVLALPYPAGGSGDTLGAALTVSDDDRVGGSYRNWSGGGFGAVIWTCASKQAYLPQG